MYWLQALVINIIGIKLKTNESETLIYWKCQFDSNKYIIILMWLRADFTFYTYCYQVFIVKMRGFIVLIDNWDMAVDIA